MPVTDSEGDVLVLTAHRTGLGSSHYSFSAPTKHEEPLIEFISWPYHLLYINKAFEGELLLVRSETNPVVLSALRAGDDDLVYLNYVSGDLLWNDNLVESFVSSASELVRSVL